MYSKITNPNTGRFVKVNSLLGKSIINNYIQAGGGYPDPRDGGRGMCAPWLDVNLKPEYRPTVAEMKVELRRLKLPAGGRKEELQTRLVEHLGADGWVFDFRVRTMAARTKRAKLAVSAQVDYERYIDGVHNQGVGSSSAKLAELAKIAERAQVDYERYINDIPKGPPRHCQAREVYTAKLAG